MKPEKFFSLTILLTVFIFLLPAGLVVVMDPYFIYHKPYFMKPPYFVHADRYQSAGMINSFLADPQEYYNKLIIGTSLSQNFTPDKNTMPLTLAGGRAKELAAMTERALATGSVKSVIWEIFISYHDNDPNDVHPESPLPLYLYNDILWDDWQYVFNESVLRESIRLIKNGNKGRKSLDALYKWGEKEKEMFREFQSPEKMIQNSLEIQKANLPFTLNPPADIVNATFPSVDQNLIRILKKHPTVHFDLFFPPVSYFEYIKSGNDRFWREMLMRLYILEQIKDFKNVKVYHFDLIDGIGNDLTIYRDSQHYPMWVNDKIMTSIKAGNHEITHGQWQSVTQSLANRINAFADSFTREEN